MKNKSLALDENGYPKPKQVQCFECRAKFWLKFLVPKQDYSLKNSWWYYTGKVQDQGKYKCNLCLRNFYLTQRKTFLEVIKNPKLRNNLRSYISKNFI